MIVLPQSPFSLMMRWYSLKLPAVLRVRFHNNDLDSLLICEMQSASFFVSDVPATPQPSRDNLCCSFSIERHTHSPRVSGSNISWQYFYHQLALEWTALRHSRTLERVPKTPWLRDLWNVPYFYEMCNTSMRRAILLWDVPYFYETCNTSMQRPKKH